MNVKPLLSLIFILSFILWQNNPSFARDVDSLVNEIEIWPDGVGPGSDTLTIDENIIVRSVTGTCTRNRAVEKVTVPTITPVIPEEPNGSAVIICPGGAYARVVYDVEGMDIGRWLNTIGITAFVLKYRLPVDDHSNKKYVPLQDARRAVRYVKANAATWQLDTNKIGISGASAGGHVASSLATMYDKQVYTPVDTIDSISARPEFMFLLYPVVSFESNITHIGSRNALIGSSPPQDLIDEFSAEKNVTANSPKTFLAHAKDDGGVSPLNSERLYQALIDSGVVAQLNLFEDGGHGVGICKAVGTDFENWPDYCTNWLYSIGMTEDTVEIIEESSIREYTETALNQSGFTIYPNPVSERSQVLYQVESKSLISISVVSIEGREISHLVNEN